MQAGFSFGSSSQESTAFLNSTRLVLQSLGQLHKYCRTVSSVLLQLQRCLFKRYPVRPGTLSFSCLLVVRNSFLQQPRLCTLTRISVTSALKTVVFRPIGTNPSSPSSRQWYPVPEDLSTCKPFLVVLMVVSLFSLSMNPVPIVLLSVT